VDFINSEEYYKENDVEKQLIATQRSGMEMYLNALSLRMWGRNEYNPSMSSMLPLLMSTMLMPTLGSPSPSATYLKNVLEKDSETKEGD
jgi:hypothetical protein